MKRAAFTLVELLVVIAIIGLLSTVAVVATAGARASSRNARRNADILQIYKAFTVAYNLGTAFPSSSGACVSASCGGGWSGIYDVPAVTAYLSPYLASKPIDPSDGKRTVTGYVYNSAFGATGPYDGHVFPLGVYLSWFVETVPNLSGICGAGAIYSSDSTQTQCFLQVDQ